MSIPGKGINLDAVKERLESLKKTKTNSNLKWKPNEKEQTIRIVPYKYQPDNPFIELYFHYNVDNRSHLSPVSFGKPDPIMEVAQQLKNAGTKEEWKMGKDLEPKLRTFAPVIVREREQEGVKFWGFGKTVYEALLSHIADEDYGDITDPTSGRDIVVWTEKAKGQDFAVPKIRIKPNPSKVTEDRDVIEKIVKEQPDIRELYDLKSYEELEVILDKYLHPDKYEDENTQDAQQSDSTSNTPNESESTEAKTEEPKKESTKPAATSVDDLDDAFAEMFEND